MQKRRKPINSIIQSYHLDKISLVNKGFIIANITFSLHVGPEQEIPSGQYRAILPAHE